MASPPADPQVAALASLLLYLARKRVGHRGVGSPS